MNPNIIPQLSHAAAKVLLAIGTTNDPSLQAHELVPLTGLSIRSCFYGLRQLRELDLLPSYRNIAAPPHTNPSPPLQPPAATATLCSNPSSPLQPPAPTATPCSNPHKTLDQAIADLGPEKENMTNEECIAQLEYIFRATGVIPPKPGQKLQPP